MEHSGVQGGKMTYEGKMIIAVFLVCVSSFGNIDFCHPSGYSKKTKITLIKTKQ